VPGLVQASNGSFCGTTDYGRGGVAADGMIFRLGVELTPFVETMSYVGKVGKTVTPGRTLTSNRRFWVTP
jgi:hypothetical protein